MKYIVLIINLAIHVSHLSPFLSALPTRVKNGYGKPGQLQSRSVTDLHQTGTLHVTTLPACVYGVRYRPAAWTVHTAKQTIYM